MVHIHSSVHLFRFIHLICAKVFFKKVVVTMHSWRGSRLSRIVWGWLLRCFCDKVIFVSDEVAKNIKVPSYKACVFPAFIPPAGVPLRLPLSILEFIKAVKSENRKLAVSNAFRLVDFEGEDLYGLDLCIKAFESDALSSSVALIFVISDPSRNVEKINSYARYVEENKLENNILIYQGAIDFYSLLTHADFSIRATNTDGDALSVRESNFLKKPCIASDVVVRPDSTVLFNNRSVESLIKKIKEMLSGDFENIFLEGDTVSQPIYFYQKLYL